MQLYRKIGGIHWIAIGRVRISFTVKRKPPTWEVFHVSDGVPVYRTPCERKARNVAFAHGRNFDYALAGKGY